MSALAVSLACDFPASIWLLKPFKVLITRGSVEAILIVALEGTDNVALYVADPILVFPEYVFNVYWISPDVAFGSQGPNVDSAGVKDGFTDVVLDTAVPE